MKIQTLTIFVSDDFYLSALQQVKNFYRVISVKKRKLCQNSFEALFRILYAHEPNPVLLRESSNKIFSIIEFELLLEEETSVFKDLVIVPNPYDDPKSEFKSFRYDIFYIPQDKPYTETALAIIHSPKT